LLALPIVNLGCNGMTTASDGVADAAMGDHTFVVYEPSPDGGDESASDADATTPDGSLVASDADATMPDGSLVASDADATMPDGSLVASDANATTGDRPLGAYDASPEADEGQPDAADASPSDAGPCPDGWGGYSPSAACDDASQGRMCGFFEGYNICLEGQWYACGGYGGRLCGGPTAPPEGARCCSSDLMRDSLDFVSACCVRGQIFGCDNNHVVYSGKCAQDAGDDAWGFHRVPDASPDGGGD
jgi:hypothetical protein